MRLGVRISSVIDYGPQDSNSRSKKMFVRFASTKECIHCISNINGTSFAGSPCISAMMIKSESFQRSNPRSTHKGSESYRKWQDTQYSWRKSSRKPQKYYKQDSFSSSAHFSSIHGEYSGIHSYPGSQAASTPSSLSGSGSPTSIGPSSSFPSQPQHSSHTSYSHDQSAPIRTDIKDHPRLASQPGSSRYQHIHHRQQHHHQSTIPGVVCSLVAASTKQMMTSAPLEIAPSHSSQSGEHYSGEDRIDTPRVYDTAPRIICPSEHGTTGSASGSVPSITQDQPGPVTGPHQAHTSKASAGPSSKQSFNIGKKGSSFEEGAEDVDRDFGDEPDGSCQSIRECS
ncbi:hypothetical protein ADUPG1_006914, partial [Aduncisulcus paluster]